MPDFPKLISRYKGLDRTTRLETLLDWSRPLIKLLTEWRTARGLPPVPSPAAGSGIS